MPHRLRQHKPRRPAKRLRDRDNDGYFFPREVAHLLGIEDIDYHQLRRLFRLVREQSGTGLNSGWSRYTLTDIAAVKVVIELCGGPEALQPGRRLRIDCVAKACTALREQGIENPLLDVQLERQGDRIFANLSGTLFDPLTGQTALRAMLPNVLRVASSVETELPTRLRQESRRTPRRTTSHRSAGQIPLEPGGEGSDADG